MMPVETASELELPRRSAVSLWKKLRSFGTGLGIEVLPSSLKVCLVELRPSGITVKDNLEIVNFRSRPAAEWGNEFQAFLDKHKQRHLSADVVLPAGETINRILNLPGVAAAELEAAVRYQLDGLHPYAEEDAVHSWSRLPLRSPSNDDGKDKAQDRGSLLVAIARQPVIHEYATIFEEAGIAVAAFLTAPAALHSALRTLQDTPANSFLALHEDPSGLHLYGESAAHPVFFAQTDQEPDRALHFASSQLRLPEDAPTARIAQLLPVTLKGEAASSYAFAAALHSAVPAQGLSINLLPVERRKVSSRLRWVPTILLLAGLAAIGLALAYYQEIENRRLLLKMNEEINRLQPEVRRVEAMEAATAQAVIRTQSLQAIADYPRQDLEILRELTRLIAPPAWLGRLDISRSTVILSGEVEQAAELLRMLDQSPLLKNSEFTSSTGRGGDNREVFTIRSTREFPGPGQAAAPATVLPVIAPPPANSPVNPTANQNGGLR